MQQLDYKNAKITETSAVIPYMNDTSHRVRVNRNTKNMVAEYEQVDYMWNERGELEDEVWSWRSTYVQPSADEQLLILEELNRYAENEIVLPLKVC